MENYNIFICYRGKGENDKRDCSDGKYIALDIYSELQKYEECNCFFAPKHYQPQDNFKFDIPKILKNVKVCILVLTTNFFDACDNEDDIVKEELLQVLDRNIIILPIFVENYSIENDRAQIKKVFEKTEYIEKFFHKTGLRYTSIYDFNCSVLYDSILDILACSECDIDVASVDEEMKIGDIINSPSITVALNKIINYLENKLYSCANLNMKTIYNEIRICIGKICDNVPHFSVLRVFWKENFEKILKKKQMDALAALQKFQKELEEKKEGTSRHADQVVLENDGILVFSQSQYVIDFLSSIRIDPHIRNSTSLYICEGRSKCKKPFEDALSIYHKLENAHYGKRTILTDCSAYQMISDKKINKIVLGACSVKTKNDKLVSFVNAAGTEVLLLLADKFNIPVYVISASGKHINEFKNRELQLAIKDLRNKEFEDVDCIDYVEMFRTPTLFFINENGFDIFEMVKYFQEDINKDKRKLSIVNQDIFFKTCDKSEFDLEKRFVQDLNRLKYNVPKLLNDYTKKLTISLEKIKGIRLFELFVILDELHQEGFLENTDIKAGILKKCNEKQKNIMEALSNVIKENNFVLQPYPIEKVKDMLLTLLDSLPIYYPEIECEISKTSLVLDADKLYAKFVQYAILPFRDATIKNMALDYPELDGYDNIIDQNNKNKLKQKIKEMLKKDKTILNQVDIIDFDFSSAKNLTTKYDDFISLNMHERTYSYGIEDEVIKKFYNNEEFAISLFVRYLRFGGRKYLYRLMHPSYHSIRFKYDNEMFYFKKFIYLIDIICPAFSIEYPSIYALITTLSSLQTLQHKFDLITQLEGETGNPWLGLYKN